MENVINLIKPATKIKTLAVVQKTTFASDNLGIIIMIMIAIIIILLVATLSGGKK